MSYYGISVIITILLTSLIAFYLLYKAKELNLGIVLSITTGSIVLGFSFSPVFKLILGLLSKSIDINQKLALVLALVIVLFIFLLFICVLSFIISVLIPKRFSSIDCGVYIDKFKEFISKNLKGLFGKLSGFAGKVITFMVDIAKNTYNLKNKLKKPVDTKQIIDTMGIEKNENGIPVQVTPDSFKNILAYIEPQSVQVPEDIEEVNVFTESETSEYVVESFESIAAVLEPENIEEPEIIEELENKDIEISEEAEKVQDVEASVEAETAEEVEVAEEVEAVADVEVAEEAEAVADVEVIEEAEAVEELEAAEEAEAAEEIEAAKEVEITDVETLLSDNDDIEITKIEDNKYVIDEVQEGTNVNAQTLVVKAFAAKDNGRIGKAIEYYIKALECEPEKEMIFWIVLDVCTLYKKLGLEELAKSILEGIVSKYGAVIKPEIKDEILKNLK